MMGNKLDTYTIKCYDGDHVEYTDEIKLPNNIKWFEDNKVDGMLDRGCRNYTSFIDVTQYDEETLKLLDDELIMVKMGTYALLYINNKRFVGHHPKYTKELTVPPISILSWNDETYKFTSVIYPLQYIGGGKFRCRVYYHNIYSYEWDASIEMSPIYLASPYSRNTRRSYNGKHNDEYANAIYHIINYGKCRLDLDILNTMSKHMDDEDFDKATFDKIFNGETVYYKDSSNI